MILSIAALGLILATSVAQADGTAPKQKKQSLHEQFSGQGYGTAGCGLGSIVFGDAPGIVQVAAGILNMTGYQTFAISSGTSNCGESGKVARANQFIEVNKMILPEELASQSQLLVKSWAVRTLIFPQAFESSTPLARQMNNFHKRLTKLANSN